MNFVAYADREQMMIDLANVLAEELNTALLTHDTASIAVPGGTTPGPIFDVLCASDIAWHRVFVMLSDERWVPETSPRSNTALLRKRLLTGRAARAQYLPLYSDAETPEERLDDLSGAIRAQLPLSVLLLGMGADMHTASLFPGADQLTAAMAPDAPVLMAMRAPGAPEPRITLSAPVLRNAISTHIVITGVEKREALERAYQLNDPIKAPVSAVLKGATIHWAE